jgi:hypothetical protein
MNDISFVNHNGLITITCDKYLANQWINIILSAARIMIFDIQYKIELGDKLFNEINILNRCGYQLFKFNSLIELDHNDIVLLYSLNYTGAANVREMLSELVTMKLKNLRSDVHEMTEFYREYQQILTD